MPKRRGAPPYRSYALYDPMYRRAILESAAARRRHNGGAPGIDHPTFAGIEADGSERWLDELATGLKDRTSQPRPRRRVPLPEPDGKQRPRGIATRRDRGVQGAVGPVPGPIVEADLEPERHAYRAHRGAWDAVRAVHGRLKAGQREVVEADRSRAFEPIPHAAPLRSLPRRISERPHVGPIERRLGAPGEGSDARGRHPRTTRPKDEGWGRPPGPPLSPSLANSARRRSGRGGKASGHERRWRPSIVNDADDFGTWWRGTADEAMAAMRGRRAPLQLTVNEAKARVGRVPEEAVDFLGSPIGRCSSPRAGRPSLGARPWAKRVARRRDEIREMTDRRGLGAGVEDRVARLNRLLLGWSNSFCRGPAGRTYRALDRHCCHRLRRWLCARPEVKDRGTSRCPDQDLDDELGLIGLSDRTRSFPWAKAGVLVRGPGAGRPPAGSDERGGETGPGGAIEAPANERAGYR